MHSDMAVARHLINHQHTNGNGPLSQQVWVNLILMCVICKSSPLKYLTGEDGDSLIYVTKSLLMTLFCEQQFPILGPTSATSV